LKIKGTALEKAKNGAVLVPKFVAAWAPGTTCWGLGRRFLDQRIGLMSFGSTTSASARFPSPPPGERVRVRGRISVGKVQFSATTASVGQDSEFAAPEKKSTLINFD
jgi:hypothetical protein